MGRCWIQSEEAALRSAPRESVLNGEIESRRDMRLQECFRSLTLGGKDWSCVALVGRKKRDRQ